MFYENNPIDFNHFLQNPPTVYDDIYNYKIMHPQYSAIKHWEDGGSMGFYQSGLDFRPKSMKQGGQLTKLDQLTNFTNYNKKQPGGWLDKYE